MREIRERRDLGIHLHRDLADGRGSDESRGAQVGDVLG